MNKVIFPLIASIAVVGIVGSNSAFALPLSVEYLDDDVCDPLSGPEDLHELGFSPSHMPPGVFPNDEEITASEAETELFTCTGDNPDTPNFLVTMTNVSPHDFIDVWFVADDLVTIGNRDGDIDQIGPIGAPAGEAFKIDAEYCAGGINLPLVSESMSLDCVFESGETWEFIVQDYVDILAIAGPSSFRSADIGGASSPSPADMSRASIIAFTEDEIRVPVGGIFEGVDTTSLLVVGAQMNAAWMIPVIVSAIGIAIVIARKF